jgi:hypothetical protein
MIVSVALYRVYRAAWNLLSRVREEPASLSVLVRSRELAAFRVAMITVGLR